MVEPKIRKKNIKIVLSSFDLRQLEEATESLIRVANQTGSSASGPIPLPTKIKKITVNSSPHIDKRAREQFEIRSYKRLINIYDPSAATIEAFRIELELSMGVEVKVDLF